jgi:hypothetical protein
MGALSLRDSAADGGNPARIGDRSVRTAEPDERLSLVYQPAWAYREEKAKLVRNPEAMPKPRAKWGRMMMLPELANELRSLSENDGGGSGMRRSLAVFLVPP